MFYYTYLFILGFSHVILMSLAMCVYSLSGVGSLLMWPEAKKDSHPTSQIKAVIVTLTTTKTNERQIGYRNKHVGDTGGATLQWECGHRLWVTLSPLGRPSTGRNLGMGQGACRSLVLKTNLGPVIHKSLVYQCLETSLCTFHQSESNPLSPGKKSYQESWSPMAPSDHWTRSGRPISASDPLKITRKLHKCNTALLFLPVLNQAGGLATVTVFRTFSILRPCSEKHLYLALVTGGSVFSSASGVFL